MAAGSLAPPAVLMLSAIRCVNGRVAAGLLGEVPGDDVLFLHRGAAFGAVHFDPLEIAGIGGRAGLEHAQRAVFKFERGHGRVFHRDPLVRQQAGCAP